MAQFNTRAKSVSMFKVAGQLRVLPALPEDKSSVLSTQFSYLPLPGTPVPETPTPSLSSKSSEPTQDINIIFISIKKNTSLINPHELASMCLSGNNEN